MKGVKDAVGITLSRAQYEECIRRQIPGARFEVTDYRVGFRTERGLAKAVDAEGGLLAILEAVEDGTLWHPRKVFIR